jgi:N-methylhydantoinase A
VRVVSIERGHDPRRFAYMPFGGGGALHVCAMMREVGVSVGLVPRYPGVTSALGCVMADMRHDAVQTLNCALDELDLAAVRERIDALAAACQARLESAGVHFVRVDELIEFDMLYAGQTHTVRVRVDRSALTREALAEAFAGTYRAAFGRTLSGIAVRVMNLRYTRIGVRPGFDLAVLAPQHTTAPDNLGVQEVHHDGRWWPATRHDRLALPVGTRVHGPAILEQPDTTVWLEPGFEATVDLLGNLVIRRETASAP